MHTRHQSFYGTIVFSIFALMLGCTPQKPAEPTPKVTVKRRQPTFDYSPKSQEKAGSAGVTIALVAPVYLSPTIRPDMSPFREMATNMGNDFEELLTAKGFTIRGPFRSRDEMVYNDKTNSDLVFFVEIDLHIDVERKWHRQSNTTTDWSKLLDQSSKGISTTTYTYTFSGDGTVGGNLVLTAVAPMHGEKLWKKSISLEKIPVSYAGATKWASQAVSLSTEVERDNVVYNAFLAQLERYYQSALDLASRQIEVEEMKSVSKEAKKADQKG